MSDPNEKRTELMRLGLFVEGGLIAVALFLGWLGFYDHRQPLGDKTIEFLVSSLIWGLVATIPMLIYLVVFHYWHPAFYRPMERFVEVHLKPLVKELSLVEMLTISVLAGIGEELFFRWSLQGGLTMLAEPYVGRSIAVAIGLVLASMLFGLGHWVNSCYGITTAVVGAYLGAAMLWTNSWVVPAVAHALFDFVALIYIARSPAKKFEPSAEAGNSNELTDD